MDHFFFLPLPLEADYDMMQSDLVKSDSSQEWKKAGLGVHQRLMSNYLGGQKLCGLGFLNFRRHDGLKCVVLKCRLIGGFSMSVTSGSHNCIRYVQNTARW